ncbi:helix-turn-helix domain-containing protein [Luteimicrobium subarcticum]|uniref:Helix-turn-helix protein n=1 Tax=Luteimicrobium subarcticum TaxID=620910 RepID=A0A2M8WU00_9MICO|nr:helix-turn-helix transcriptional regulator [Luteimicrobium subarcticum]PJI94384.1 helix-turn-helix protein [Luteimicrobium subarcticum]
MIVLRREIGDVLRDVRQRQGRTLREVSSAARVSLGYLSEVERGQKEASSELLGSICEALDVPLWLVLREVSDRVAVAEGFSIPDTVPADLTMSALAAPPVGDSRDELVRELLREPSRGYRAPDDLAPVG